MISTRLLETNIRLTSASILSNTHQSIHLHQRNNRTRNGTSSFPATNSLRVSNRPALSPLLTSNTSMLMIRPHPSATDHITYMNSVHSQLVFKPELWKTVVFWKFSLYICVVFINTKQRMHQSWN